MIDPKLNEIPAPAKILEEESTRAGDQRGVRSTARQGLSINDTIASNANLSSGSRGVNTSGVKSGAGAAAGQSNLTPAALGESPAPNIVPGSRGTGTTVHGDGGSDETASILSGDGRFEDNPQNSGSSLSAGSHDSHIYDSSLDYDPSYDEISTHAYRCWCERGCPEGSPEEDWRRAERELRARGRTPRAAAATA